MLLKVATGTTCAEGEQRGEKASCGKIEAREPAWFKVGDAYVESFRCCWLL